MRSGHQLFLRDYRKDNAKVDTTDHVTMPAAFSAFLHFLGSYFSDQYPSLIMFGDTMLCGIYNPPKCQEVIAIIITEFDPQKDSLDDQSRFLKAMAKRIAEDFLGQFDHSLQEMKCQENAFEQYEERCLMLVYDEVEKHFFQR
jgi:hypothetical protein